MKLAAGLLLLIANLVFAQVSPQQNMQMNTLMHQMYPQYLTPQQQLQLAQIPPNQRMQLMQSIYMGNNQYAMQFMPQTGPMMGQSLWAVNNSQNSLFNFFTSLGSITKSFQSAEYIEARESIAAYHSPDPSESRTAPEAAIEVMNKANTKLKVMKNIEKSTECLDCITDPNPTFTAGPISGVGSVKTSGVGGPKEDLNADIKCSTEGEVIDGGRITFKASLELKIEHNKVKAFKYTAFDGKKTCTLDLTTFPQKQIGDTTNIGLNHKNGESFVVIYPANKLDKKNPILNIGASNYQDFCPQINPNLFMQIEANPKTGKCK